MCRGTYKSTSVFYECLAISPFQAFGNTNWQMNRLVRTLLIVSTNLNGFMANHNLNDSTNLQIFLPAKLSRYMVYWLRISETKEKMMG